MKKIRNSILILFLTVLLTSCNNNEKNTLDKAIFGPEIYNATYISLPGDTVEHVIPIMSKVDLSDISSYDVKYSGGQATYTCSIENTEYDLDEYHLYRLVIDFTDINFTDNTINIEKIVISKANSEEYEIVPDKCEITQVNGEYSTEDLNINGSPLKMPSDMQYIPLELSTDEDIEITNINLSNNALTLNEYSDVEGKVTEEFTTFTLYKNGSIKTWTANFIIETDDLAKYKQYGTSLVIEYMKDNIKYYTTAAVPKIIYNPFSPDYETIEPYYEYLLGE